MNTRQQHLSLALLGTTLIANVPVYHALASAPVFPPAIRLTADEFRSQYPTGALDDLPIVVTDALTPLECEDLCDQWIQAVGDEPITLQRKRHQNRNGKPSTQLYECTVAQSLDLMMQSTPNDSIFAFVEGLLEDHSSISDKLIATRESLFANDNSHNDNSKNWFDFFPDSAKPTDCVVVAGEGATSTLHRDPFEWTGTSLCLEGRKVWRFLAPPERDWDTRLESYRLNSMAWGNDDSDEEDTIILSAGWQSDLSLYHRQANANLRTGRELAEIPEEEAELYLTEMASNSNRLAPPKELWESMKGCSVVQHPGELLVIPPYWYHQTYAPEPSLAVASQRCGSRLDAARVIGHIMSLQDGLPTLPHSIQTILEAGNKAVKEDPQTTVTLLFDQLKSGNKVQ